MKKTLFVLIFTLLASCATYRVPEHMKNDFSTRGPLSADVFQVIIIQKPDESLKTQSAQRESAYILAMNSIKQECINQLFTYYYEQKKSDEKDTPAEKINTLTVFFTDLAENAVIEQEFYQQDNSVVLVIRISGSDINNKILNY